MRITGAGRRGQNFSGPPWTAAAAYSGGTMRATALVLLLLAPAAPAFDLAEALPLTDRILMIHVKEGHAVHHRKGQKRDEGERIVLMPLDAAAASRPVAWTVTCAD